MSSDNLAFPTRRGAGPGRRHIISQAQATGLPDLGVYRGAQVGEGRRSLAHILRHEPTGPSGQVVAEGDRAEGVERAREGEGVVRVGGEGAGGGRTAGRSPEAATFTVVWMPLVHVGLVHTPSAWKVLLPR